MERTALLLVATAHSPSLIKSAIQPLVATRSQKTTPPGPPPAFFFCSYDLIPIRIIRRIFLSHLTMEKSVETAAVSPNPTTGENENQDAKNNSKKQRPGPCGWLREHRVSSLTRYKQRLVEVPYTATVSDTANALQANSVSAMAVAAPPGQWIGAGGSMILESDPATGAVRKHYIGMVTMLDILVHIAEAGLEGGGEWEEKDLDQSMAVPVSSVIGHSLEGLSLWTLNPNTR